MEVVANEITHPTMEQTDPKRHTIRVVPLDDPDAPHVPSPWDCIGATLSDKYRLERLLGTGGMGSVYLSTHIGTGRDVALKLIAPQFMRNAHFVERFRREARAAGRLRHPHIVDVTDFGFARLGDDEVAYLVMEYLDGCSLGQVLREEKSLPLPRVVEILEQVCSAVQEAHQNGIVHRDLKPDNIWLEPDRLGGFRAKVLDFGIAQLVDETAHGMIAPVVSKDTGDSAEAVLPGIQTAALTRVGSVLGTPLYMSPEQCRGESLDARSDIYSLGIIAYQMLSGSPPFLGDVADVLEAHQSTAPTTLRQRRNAVLEAQDSAAPAIMRQRCQRLPAGVDRVVMSALDKDPARRPPTAMSLANGLRAHAQGLGSVYRRAFALYSEHLPAIIRLSALAHVPLILVVLITIGLGIARVETQGPGGIVLSVFFRVLNPLATLLAATIISGVLTVLAAQWEVAPLKVLPLRWAFDFVRRRRRALLKTAVLSLVHVVFGFVLLVVPGLVIWARESFWAPVVLMEGLDGSEAFRRSRQLASRCRWAVGLTVVLQLLFPAIMQAMLGMNPTQAQGEAWSARQAWVELSSLVGIITTPLMSLVVAQLYLKARQLGGETLGEMMSRADGDTGLAEWERRMRVRLPRTRIDPLATAGLHPRSGVEPRSGG
jgi:serine/threonine protein kinase